MTATDRSNAAQLINYWEAKAEKSRNLSRRDGVGQFSVGFSSGMAAARLECISELRQLLEAGDLELGDASSLFYERGDNLMYDGPYAGVTLTGAHYVTEPRKTERQKRSISKWRRFMKKRINTWRGRK